MTNIKTWQQLKALSNGQWPQDACMDAEITELRAALAERDVEIAKLKALQNDVNSVLELSKAAFNVLQTQLDERDAECLRLAGEVSNRNLRALEGDKATAAFNDLYVEHEALRAALAVHNAPPEAIEQAIYVEVRPCKRVHRGDVEQCLEADADFFGVYCGRPAGLMWQADFATYPRAAKWAAKFAKKEACTVRDCVQIERAAK